MCLRSVPESSSNSITHLHSPVDLLLDGRLIAQGEVVIVDGKYGLRITDVVDPRPASDLPSDLRSREVGRLARN